MAQIKIVTMYAVKTLNQGLYEQENCDKREERVRMMVDTEEEAKKQIKSLVERICFSDHPLEFDRNVIEDRTGVVFSSIDPKKDGYYKIWYEPMDIVLN